jgi:hypothetical protein
MIIDMTCFKSPEENLIPIKDKESLHGGVAFIQASMKDQELKGMK